MALSFSLQPKASADIPTHGPCEGSYSICRPLVTNNLEGSLTMSKVSRETASKVNDMGVAEDRTEEFDGYTVNFVSIRQDADLAPMLKGLPDDRCQCPHWGYVFKGQMTVSYAEHEDVIGPGDAFYMPPGHTPAAIAGTEFVQFSPTDELAVSEAAMAKNMQEMHGGR
jgi:hypothetical protein